MPSFLFFSQTITTSETFNCRSCQLICRCGRFRFPAPLQTSSSHGSCDDFGIALAAKDKIFEFHRNWPIVQWYNDYTISNIGSWLHVVPSHYGLDCFSISIIFRDLRTANRWWLEVSDSRNGSERGGHHLCGDQIAILAL